LTREDAADFVDRIKEKGEVELKIDYEGSGWESKRFEYHPDQERHPFSVFSSGQGWRDQQPSYKSRRELESYLLHNDFINEALAWQILTDWY